VLAVLITGCTSTPTARPTGSADPGGSTLATPVTPSATATGSASARSPLSTPSAAPTPGVRTIEIELADGRVSPNGKRVDLSKGETFILDITSDRDDEVHVHGLEAEIKVKAGEHKKVELVAERTGRFEVESHHPELLIVVLQVR